MVIFKAKKTPNISKSSLVKGSDLFNDFLQFTWNEHQILVILGQISKTRPVLNSFFPHLHEIT